MSDWKLLIENIGGFKEPQEFLLKEGLNLILGDNATGKTSIINALKLLNNLNLKEAARADTSDNSLTFKDFLHNKTKSGLVQLINSHSTYQINITSPVVNITSFIDGVSPTAKSIKKKLLSIDPNIINFTFLDKNNKIMESIEYSGNVELITDEIIKISNIKNYELILKHAKKLNLEYIERREKSLKTLNDSRKEIELKIRVNLKKAETLEIELSSIHVNEELSEELTELKEKLEDKNAQYNKLRLKELDVLNEQLNKLGAILDKDNKTLKSSNKRKSELDDFTNTKNNIAENEIIIQEFDNTLENLRIEKSDLNISKRISDAQIQNLSLTLKENNDTELCQHCLNPINFKKITKRLKELTSTKQKLNAQSRDFDSNIKNIEKQRNKLSELIQNQKNIPKDIADLSSKINSLEKKIETNKIKQNELEFFFVNKNMEVDQIKTDIKELQEKIIEASAQDENLKEKHTEILTKLNIIKEENDKLTNDKNKIVQKILILPESFNQLTKRTEKIIEVLNEKIEAFYLEFIDYINSELETMLKNLNWSFQEVYIDDDLSLIIKNSEGKPQKFKSLSDFEKKSIAILILLIIKSKYFPEYPIIAIDEHLNSADPQRFENFIPHLQKLVENSGIKLLIITLLPNESENEFFTDFEKNQYEQLTIYHQA